MPVKAPPRVSYAKKKPTKHFLKIYWPYLPLAISIALSLLVGFYLRPKVVSSQSTLAYATNMSVSGLLEATNQQRAKNGNLPLTLNERLTKAAQAKADDMAKSNYWSHISPDGRQPWFFFDLFGYDYTKAGENLAYGFDTYLSVVNGWMNSPSHRDNLLDGSFMEVGFGMANAGNYQEHGPQTIVVAHYGRPLSAGEATPSNLIANDAEQLAPSNNPLQVSGGGSRPSDTTTQPEEKKISLAQILGDGRASWANNLSLGILLGSLGAYLILKHGLALRRALKQGERFVLHHPLLDATIVSFIVLGILLAQNVGVIL